LSFFGRYSFRPGALRGLTLGGGVSRISERTVSSSNYNTGITPAPALLFLKPGTNVSVFATYKIDSHWSVRANVENLLDEAYAAGAQTAYFVDPSPPRTVSASVTYKF
jgi:outer membrane receptor protein involved in Fe transport